ncbi:DUF3307 domain-containing protein [Pedobacter nyackensis]|uniref:DUF3307 domain-containing protein n=1 Tax=Pedobacter nyackensis TaxID=475255 RepID=A0A1W2EKB1_9SPHI|nr:DUF3307 domain-containing protein [Pedobacter nyackensis]SMD10124.1 Protein of unknown function [Pedobacter nyackensis]
MEINLLLRLVIAHLLTDFVLQPKSWVTDREKKQGKSTKLYLHVIVTTIVAYLFSGMYDNWIIPLVILSSHLLIDYIKSKADKDKFSYFIADQIAHLFVIVMLWLCIENNWGAIQPFTQQITNSSKFWIIATGYIFISWPLGIIIGKATQKWRDQITREKVKAAEDQRIQQEIIETSNEEEHIPVTPAILKRTEEQELGLASAGKWIGICERVLILTFVLMSQYTAIGFLMTAKSILRFSEKENNTQLKTEYVLVGTLVSFASSAMIGVLIQIALTFH